MEIYMKRKTFVGIIIVIALAFVITSIIILTRDNASDNPGGDVGGGVDYKPVIYLYPEEKTDISVTLTLNGRITSSYPVYNDGWRVTANPDGTLTDSEGLEFNYLFWEGVTYAEYDMSRGFCVKGTETAVFLEWALAELGLNRREACEFIVFWLPLMEQNEYNVISFQGAEYTESARLEVSPSPDTVIRVFMAYYKSSEFVEIEAQKLSAQKRDGFTLVEWGGTVIEK